jgi:hypothetical protein
LAIVLGSRGGVSPHILRLSFTITENGRAVTRLKPYLGAYGHLVALEKGTLAYTHVHPYGESLGTGTIRFDADFPAAKTYRLFVQVPRRRGAAAFTLKVGS